MGAVANGVVKYLIIDGLGTLTKGAAPTEHPSSVKIPCVSIKGALQDYLFIIVRYEKFGGDQCYAMLPQELKDFHEYHCNNVKAYIEKNFVYLVKNAAKTNKSISRRITRPSSVWLACESPATAAADYRRVVIKYQKYSGPNCWGSFYGPPNLPVPLQRMHNELALVASAILDNASRKEIDRQKLYYYTVLKEYLEDAPPPPPPPSPPPPQPTPPSSPHPSEELGNRAGGVSLFYSNRLFYPNRYPTRSPFFHNLSSPSIITWPRIRTIRR